MRYHVFGLLAFCGLFQNGFPIMCYECNSATNSLCAQKVLPDSLMRNCSEHDRGVTHTLCRKTVQHVDFEINGQLPVSRVIRSCGWDESRYKGSCYHRAGYGGHQEVCSCTKDLCNGAGDTAPLRTLIFSTVIMASLKLICQ